MTIHVHDPSVDADDSVRGDATATGHPGAAFRRPAWLLPALAIGVVGIGLVVAGVASLTTVLYVGAFGGMLLMHLGGHGHGGHGNGGHGNRGPADDLSRGSGGSHQQRTGSEDELEDRAASQPNRNERHDDQHRSHGCH